MSNVTQTSETSEFVKIETIQRVKWNTDTDFDKGDYTDTERNGTGVDTTVRLKGLSDSDIDIDYDTVGDYTLSDGAKITVDEGGNNKAALKILGGESKNWPLTTPANYTYTGSDVSVDGKGKLVSQETDGIFIANFRNTINATFATGDDSGTATGGASISGGKLDLSNGTLQYLDFDATDNADNQQKGCIRFLVTPDYSGSPVSTQVFFSLNKVEGDTTNLIQIQQQTAGHIRGVIKDENDAVLAADNFAVWNPTSGVEYEIEYNWDIDTGTLRMFIDGVQQGSTTTGATGTRTSSIDLLRVGTNGAKSVNPDFKMRDLVIYDSVQHTANYTPATLEPFLETDPTILTNTGLAFTSALDTFTETSTKYGSDELKYQVSSDDGTIYKWWNGSAWVARTIASTHILASAITTNTGTLDAGNLASVQTLDASTYDVSEVPGVPGFDIEIDFSGLLGPPDQFTFHGYYDGQAMHVVDVDIWNYDTTTWDTLDQIPDDPTTTITQYDITVTGTKTDYISSGAAKVRIYHSSSGNASDDIVTDYVYLLTTPTDSGYYDNEANNDSTIHTNIGALGSSGTFKWVSYLHSFDGIDTPRLDNIFASSSSTYSTTDDLYIDTKAASQVVPSDLSQWLTMAVTNTLPNNTDIRVILSTDDRVSWQTWSGSAWVAPTSATDRTDATSITDAQTNFTSLAVGDKTLDVRLFLYTSNSAVTPSVDNINITGNGGFELTGSYESNIYDSGQVSKDWDLVGFNAEIPSGTTLVFKVRASNDSDTMGSYSSAVSNGEDVDAAGRYFQWKADLTPSATETPEVDYFFIEYSLFFTSEVSP